MNFWYKFLDIYFLGKNVGPNFCTRGHLGVNLKKKTILQKGQKLGKNLALEILVEILV
jgi:hypothetical protein